MKPMDDSEYRSISDTEAWLTVTWPSDINLTSCTTVLVFMGVFSAHKARLTLKWTKSKYKQEHRVLWGKLKV